MKSGSDRKSESRPSQLHSRWTGPLHAHYVRVITFVLDQGGYIRPNLIRFARLRCDAAFLLPRLSPLRRNTCLEFPRHTLVFARLRLRF